MDGLGQTLTKTYLFNCLLRKKSDKMGHLPLDFFIFMEFIYEEEDCRKKTDPISQNSKDDREDHFCDDDQDDFYKS